MVLMQALWLPILLSAFAVFMLSALVWTALKVHDGDWKPLPAEEGVLTALRATSVAPGQYYFPKAKSDAMSDPAAAEFLRANPNGYVYVDRPGGTDMRRSIGLGLLYNVIVMSAVAYVVGRALPPGSDYLSVFRMVAVIAWLAYGAAHFQYANWFAHSWTSMAKQVAEAFVYAVVAAGIFGWLWPS